MFVLFQKAQVYNVKVGNDAVFMSSHTVAWGLYSAILDILTHRRKPAVINLSVRFPRTRQCSDCSTLDALVRNAVAKYCATFYSPSYSFLYIYYFM